MKTKLLAFASALLTSCSSPSALSSLPSYLVTIKKDTPKTEVFHPVATDSIDILIVQTFGINIPADTLLKTSDHFQVITDRVWFYCEDKTPGKKRIKSNKN